MAKSALEGINTKLINDIPYSIVPGNHDYDCHNNKKLFSSYQKYFGPNRYSGKDWFLLSDSKGMNIAQKIIIKGKSIIHIGLEWRPSDLAIEFAQEIIVKNPQIPILITTHEYLDTKKDNKVYRSNLGNTENSSGNNSAEQLFRKLVEPYPQVFMVFSGHNIGDEVLISNTALDKKIIQVLANFQDEPNGGNGWLKIIKFNLNKSKIKFKTFSPTYIPGLNTGKDLSKDVDAQISINFDLNHLYKDLESNKILHFRNGQNNGFIKYNGTIEISNERKNLNFLKKLILGKNKRIFVVEENSKDKKVLIKFADIIGDKPGQIPKNVKIKKAILTLTSEGINLENNGVNIFQINKNWNKNISPEDLIDFLSIDDNFLNKPINTIEKSIKGTRSFDVTKSVQDWADGIDNNGWVFKGKAGTIWNFRSSNWEGESERPMLTVIY